jgi:hypothetical protein
LPRQHKFAQINRSFESAKRMIGRDPGLTKLFFAIKNADENPENGIQ